MSDILCESVSDKVATWELDCGKLNVLTREAVEAMLDALARAEASDDTQAIVLHGRGDAFTAGLDLETLTAGGRPAGELLIAMGDLLTGIYRSSVRFVSAVRGHAVASGAMILCVSDTRVLAAGDYKVGFSEVRRGLPLPRLAVMLAEDRLLRSRLQEATLHARLYTPEEAVEVGFADRVVPAVAHEDAALDAARDLAALPEEAYAQTVPAVRRATLTALEALLAEERRRLPPD